MKEKTILKELKARGWNMQFDAREKHLIKEIAEITEKQTFSEIGTKLAGYCDNANNWELEESDEIRNSGKRLELIKLNDAMDVIRKHFG